MRKKKWKFNYCFIDLNFHCFVFAAKGERKENQTIDPRFTETKRTKVGVKKGGINKNK